MRFRLYCIVAISVCAVLAASAFSLAMDGYWAWWERAAFAFCGLVNVVCLLGFIDHMTLAAYHAGRKHQVAIDKAIVITTSMQHIQEQIRKRSAAKPIDDGERLMNQISEAIDPRKAN